jgi:hypothetical protein
VLLLLGFDSTLATGLDTTFLEAYLAKGFTATFLG